MPACWGWRLGRTVDRTVSRKSYPHTTLWPQACAPSFAHAVTYIVSSADDLPDLTCTGP